MSRKKGTTDSKRGMVVATTAEPAQRRSLTLNGIPLVAQVYEEVPVPEFGEDENGEALVVYVRPLSVLTNNILTKMMNKFDLDDMGQIVRTPNHDRDEPCIIAALCAYDAPGDTGNLVFGVDYDDAIARVESLPTQYRPAIYRISQSAIEQARVVAGGKTAVEDARKNS